MYDLQIELLEFWIENWNNITDELTLEQEISKLYDCAVKYYLEMYSDIRSGLCKNANIDDLNEDHIDFMFESWSGFSGSYTYPVDGCFVKYNLIVCMTDNPKRLDLAKHCLQYLKDLHKQIEDEESQYEL